MRNHFAGTCYRCGKLVAPGEGHFQRVRGDTFGKRRWATQHADCAIKYRGTDQRYAPPTEQSEAQP